MLGATGRGRGLHPTRPFKDGIFGHPPPKIWAVECQNSLISDRRYPNIKLMYSSPSVNIFARKHKLKSVYLGKRLSAPSPLQKCDCTPIFKVCYPLSEQLPSASATLNGCFNLELPATKHFTLLELFKYLICSTHNYF